MKRFDPGQLRHRIIVEEVATSYDEAGGFSESWTEKARCAAFVKPASVSEVARARAAELEMSHSFIIRSGTEVTRHDRVIWRGEAYEIASVSDIDGTDRYTEILGNRIEST